MGQWGILENLLTGLGVAVVVVVEEPAGDRPPPPLPLGTCGGAGAGNLCLDRGSVCCTAPILARPFPLVVPGNILVARIVKNYGKIVSLCKINLKKIGCVRNLK